VNDSLALRVRDIVAGHFGMPSDRLTGETRLRDDLGADQFDRIELMIAIEDQVLGVRIDDMALDEIKTVGDLVQAVAGLSTADALKRGRLDAVPQGES
jgi:acyl carrier protein